MSLPRRIANLFRRSRIDREIADELSTHIALRTEENIAAGMTSQEARRNALLRFGNPEVMKEHTTSADAALNLDRLWFDLRFALRQLRKSPGFTLTAILTLALGIGATAAVFSVVNAVLLRPFAFPNPDRLVVIREVRGFSHDPNSILPDNYRHIQHLRATSKTLEDAAVFWPQAISVSPNSEHPYMIGGISGTPNLLHVLGAEPMMGRSLVDADASKGAPPVAVISYEAWRTLMAGDPNAVGKTLRMNGNPVTVVGVLHPSVRFPQFVASPDLQSSSATKPRPPQIYRPLIPTEWITNDDIANYNFKVIARLKPGIEPAAAQAELESLQRSYSASAHLPASMGIALTPLLQDASSSVSTGMWLLFAAVGAVLLIACVNLANLQLARAVSAQHETAIRAALGASKGRLVMARLAESLLLAIAGGTAGVALAFLGVRLLLALMPANLPRFDEVRVSTPVLVFAAALAMLCSVLFGLLPALRSLRVQPQKALQSNSSRTVNSHQGLRTRSVMVAAQVTCTLVLLILTSLVLRSFSRLLHQERGFDTSHVAFAQVDLLAPKFDDSLKGYDGARLTFTDRAKQALQQLPGVQSVALTSAVPLTGETWVDALIRPDHPEAAGHRPYINVRWISPDYLATMRISLLSGRDITESDRANPFVALISERVAREGFPGENPIGHTLSDIVPNGQHSLTIIGVVADAHINGLKNDAAVVYLPYWTYVP